MRTLFGVLGIHKMSNDRLTSLPRRPLSTRLLADAYGSASSSPTGH